MPRLGDKMHRENCGPVLIDFFAKVREIQDRAEQEQTMAYFLGFLTHHILDRNFHPYIHFKAGYRKWDHQRFEVIMDTLFMEKKKGLSTWKTPVWKELDAGSELPRQVVSILRQTAEAWYTEAEDIPSGYWNAAYRDMIRAQKLFHDPSGWKRVLTGGQIEPMVYKKNNAPLDYFNEAKAVWKHCAVEEETFTTSAWDLWEQSLEDGRNVLAALLGWLNSQGQEQSAEASQAKRNFIHVLENRSYDTGKDCDSGLESRFAESVFD
jgi:hypothetical protein